ncbi:MAG TPA: serine--tRNA ligase [Acidimicrobiales bacterium]|nr:serine--tRNA ligase [Acidimicrobiales bacterium]
MIDARRLRTDLDGVKAALARRGEPAASVDRLAELDRRERALRSRADELRGRVKALSREVGQARREGDVVTAEERAAESRSVGEEVKAAEAEAAAIGTELRDLLLRTPNLPSPDAPDGPDASANVVVRIEGPAAAGQNTADAYGPHQRVSHWDIGAELGILDLEAGARLSGSMFPLYRGEGARLARALCQFALDLNRDAYEEIRPPTLVRTETMVSTGHLPKFEDDAYHLERDDLWAIPTAEVPLTSLGRDQVFDEADLPVRLMAHTSCFRREAGSAGRDTRGLLRVHEFDKVEILAYATEAQAADMHADILGRAEAALAALGLTYRVLDLAAGDLGASSARTFDLEVYAPGCDMWLEASSVSWFSDYQARRANIRYRPAGAGSGTVHAHTLNGSALAVPRVWAALVETHRQPDGSIALPPALRPYFAGASLIASAGGVTSARSS